MRTLLPTMSAVTHMTYDLFGAAAGLVMPAPPRAVLPRARGRLTPGRRQPPHGALIGRMIMSGKTYKSCSGTLRAHSAMHPGSHHLVTSRSSRALTAIGRRSHEHWPDA